MGKIIDISEVQLEMGLSASITDEERAILLHSIKRAEGAVIKHLRYDPVQRTRTEFYPQMDYDQGGREGVWEIEGNSVAIRKISQASTDELQVRHLPIRSITELYIDLDGRSGKSSGAFAASSLKSEGVDYWANYDALDGADTPVEICRDGIIRSIGRWPTTPGTVKIVYVAGYTPAEFHGQDTQVDATSILDAVLSETVIRAQRAFSQKKSDRLGFVAGTVTTEKMGDYEYEVADNAQSIGQTSYGSSVTSGEAIELLSEFVNHGWMLAS